MVLDTNILIAYLGGEDSVIQQIEAWRDQGRALLISSIAECELFSYPHFKPGEEAVFERFVSDHLVPVPFDGVRARNAARLRQVLPSLKLPDAAIASLALEMNVPLVTRNIRDFKKIPNLDIKKL